jgi:hypothetical protein
VFGPIVSEPGAVWMIVSGPHGAGLQRGGDRERLERRAGSNTSVSARLRILSRATRLRALGL